MRREREDKEGRTALRNGGADSVNTRRAPTRRLSQGGREGGPAGRCWRATEGCVCVGGVDFILAAEGDPGVG